MKILVTGAHFTPAQAVIEELKDTAEIVYVGRKYTLEGDRTPSVESQVLPKLGVKFIPITTGRVSRFISLGTLTSLLKIPVGFIQAFKILLEEKPDVILSFGGYVGVPTVVMGWFLSIPVILHEQTLVMGLANRVSSLFASKVCVSFPQLKSRKYILTGNPLRKEILDTNNVTVKQPLIIVMGGNQGSHIINQTIGEILPELTKIAHIVHQTGESKYDDYNNLVELRAKLENKGRYSVKKWIDGKELGGLLKNATLVVSRAGANTLLELAYFGIPALVIPIPYLYNDEQNKNANYFKKYGLCTIITQNSLTPKSLLLEIEQMIKNITHLKKEASEAKKLVIIDAAKRVALETVLLNA